MGSKRYRNRQPPLTAQKYLDAVAKLAQAADLAPGTVAVIEVRHEPGCDLLGGRGACSCSPAVRMSGTH